MPTKAWAKWFYFQLVRLLKHQTPIQKSLDRDTLMPHKVSIRMSIRVRASVQSLLQRWSCNGLWVNYWGLAMLLHYCSSNGDLVIRTEEPVAIDRLVYCTVTRTNKFYLEWNYLLYTYKGCSQRASSSNWDQKLSASMADALKMSIWWGNLGTKIISF